MPDNRHVFEPVRGIFRAYWKLDRWMILLSFAIVPIASCGAIAAPIVFSRIIDALPRDRAVEGVAFAFIVCALLLGLSSVLQQMVQFLSLMTARNLGFVASTQFFETILRKTSAFFIEHNPSEIMLAGAKGQGALTQLLQLGLIVFIPGMVQIALTLVTLGAMIDLQVVAIVAAYGVFSTWLTLVSTRRARIFLDRAVEAGQENSRFVGNAMNAMETLRQFGSHAWMKRRFVEKAEEVRASWRSYVLQRIGYVAVIGLGLALQFAVTLLLLLPRYQSGELSVGDLVLFNALLIQLNMPFEMIAHTLDDLARVRSDLAPMSDMWRAGEERVLPHAAGFSPRTGKLQFENVGYAYDNGRGVENVSFDASRGGITFLVGETGSGKSTIFKLALKSMPPTAGRIVIDGTDLETIGRADWYSAIAVVPQEVILLNETLADNILLGRPRDEKRLRLAAGKAAILTFIEDLPDGFETTVGERGLKLSGGERQRIAIARALYGDPAILFLDEASSALDEATEKGVMEHIRILCSDVTVLAITHRRSVIGPADRIVSLDTPAEN